MNNASGSDLLRFPYREAPAPGTVQEAAPGVKWLRMPLPFALDHISLWVLEDDHLEGGDGLMLVDTGIDTPVTRELWEIIFAGPLAAKPVTRLLCTHFHPDHIGLAGWLAARHGVALQITDREWDTATAVWSGAESAATSGFYARAGYSADAEDAPRNAYASRVHPLPRDRLRLDPAVPFIAGGTSWRVVVGEGHSPQLAALYSAERGVLISGDQILPGISPNVSVFASDPEANPLKAFLDSFERFRALPADTLVLPSHKLPFYGLHARIDQIAAHHADRLKVARTACGAGATALEVLRAIFPRALDKHQIHFALGETLAHLNYLRAAGQIERIRGTGPDIYRSR